MNATRNPKPSSGSSNLVIHPQCSNGGSSASCAAYELGAIGTPSKMPKQTVVPWVIELYLTPGLWTSSSDFPALELIAERATQAAILKFARTSRCLRNDMIHMKGCQRHLLKSQAILASIFRTVPYELA